MKTKTKNKPKKGLSLRQQVAKLRFANDKEEVVIILESILRNVALEKAFYVNSPESIARQRAAFDLGMKAARIDDAFMAKQRAKP